VLDLIVYQGPTGQRPFETWLESLRDKKAQARIVRRTSQIQNGNFGDCKPVGEGVLELRIDVGAGYRVYCGQHGTTLVILLCGGDESTQDRDIKRAKEYWTDWRRRQK
jgi:putative addiction module killer protein